MKQIMLVAGMLACLGVCSQALADTATSRPSSLICTSTGEGEAAQFTIERFDTDQPETSLDGNTLSFVAGPERIELSVSNECDNLYDIRFPAKAMRRLARGMSISVAGKMSYYNADMMDSTGRAERQKASVRCSAR